MPTKRVREESVRVRMFTAEKRLFERAAASINRDLSDFARTAMEEKVERLRAEGKKL